MKHFALSLVVVAMAPMAAFAGPSVSITDVKAAPAGFEAGTKSLTITVKADCQDAHSCTADVSTENGGVIVSDCDFDPKDQTVSCTASYDLTLADRDAKQVTFVVSADAMNHESGDSGSDEKELTVKGK